MKQYGKKNLRKLSIEMMLEYVYGTIIHLMIAENKKASKEEVRGDEERYDEAK
jgi:hypothetical protein